MARMIQLAITLGALALTSVAPAEEVTSIEHERVAMLPAFANFSQKDRVTLGQELSVKRRFQIQRGEVEYHAGLAYRLVQAKPMDVIRALRKPDGIVRAIPYAIEATTVSEADGVARVRIRQGKSPVIGKYSVHLEWDLGTYEARFWMDPNERHDVSDLWGVFSAKEVVPGWTLISFGFAFDIGGVGSLLESKAQRWALQTADRIAEMVEPQQATNSQKSE